MSDVNVERRFVPARTAVWRILRLVGLGLLVLMVVVGIYCAVGHHRVSRALEKAVAELDQSETGWRLEEIEAAREKVPDEDNSAPVVVKDRLPGGYEPGTLSIVRAHLVAVGETHVGVVDGDAPQHAIRSSPRNSRAQHNATFGRVSRPVSGGSSQR